MDFKINTVTRSKSSKGAINHRAESKKNKKSSSYIRFSTSLAKKRGIYVEKLQSPISTQDTKDNVTQKKPPQRPHPGQKKFLASVLTLLSKSTISTQCPDVQNNTTKNTYDSEYKITHKIKKTKYRSRILNDDILKFQKGQLIVLQPKKEIVQTPSNNSVRTKILSDSIRLSDDNKSKLTRIRNILENNICCELAQGNAQEQIEEKSKRENKLWITDNPETAKKDSRNMQDFFIDPIKTTISSDTVKTEHDIGAVSKTTLELDDVDTLDFKNYLDNTKHYTPKCNHRQVLESNIFNFEKNIPNGVKQFENKMCLYNKLKIKSEFLDNSTVVKKKTNSQSKSKSFDSKKKWIRKSNKKQIIKELKKELAKDKLYPSNKTRSLYDELTVMVKNKKRNEQSIYCFNKMYNKSNYLDPECMFEKKM